MFVILFTSTEKQASINLQKVLNFLWPQLPCKNARFWRSRRGVAGYTNRRKKKYIARIIHKINVIAQSCIFFDLIYWYIFFLFAFTSITQN